MNPIDWSQPQMNRLGFAQAVLNALGVPNTADNQAAMLTWMWAEEGAGMNTAATFNPLNVQDGSWPLTSTGQSIYPDWNTGVAATANVIRQPNMAGIYTALQGGNSAAGVLDAIQQSPWAGGHYGYGLVDQLAATLADWAGRANAMLAGVIGGGGLGTGGAGVAPGAAGGPIPATTTGATPFPLSLFGDPVGNILSGVGRLVLIGLGVGGGLTLIALGAHRAVTPMVQARTQDVTDVAPAVATAAKFAV